MKNNITPNSTGNKMKDKHKCDWGRAKEIRLGNWFERTFHINKFMRYISECKCGAALEQNFQGNQLIQTVVMNPEEYKSRRNKHPKDY